jgi:hypothetical protein
MAYLARPETKAQLKRRAQEIDARSKARLAAGRKKHAQVMADPKGYRTAPTQAAESTAELMIEQAERHAQKIIEEAERHGIDGKLTCDAVQHRRRNVSTASMMWNLRAVEPRERDAECLRVENGPRQPEASAISGEEQAVTSEVAIQHDAAFVLGGCLAVLIERLNIQGLGDP